MKILPMLALAVLPVAAADSEPAIEPKAVQTLERMSAYMTGLQQFTFHATNTNDILLLGNQKITMIATSEVSVKRPDRVRSDRIGELSKLQFFFDGRSFTLFEPTEAYYAQQEFSQNLDELLERLRDGFDIDMPGADLLYENPAKELLEAAEAGAYLGEAEVDGVLCHHLAFRTADVDWQIWIEAGDRPLPRRYSVVSKWTTSAPEAAVEFYDWDLSAALPDSVFQFQPPADARKIVFEEVNQ